MTQEQFLEKLPKGIFDKAHIKIWLNRFDNQFVENILFYYILDEFSNTAEEYISDDRNERVTNLYKRWEREQKINQILK